MFEQPDDNDNNLAGTTCYYLANDAIQFILLKYTVTVIYNLYKSYI